MESASVKQWPLKLGNASSLSDNAPGGVICEFATIHKPAVVEVHMYHVLGHASV